MCAESSIAMQFLSHRRLYRKTHGIMKTTKTRNSYDIYRYAGPIHGYRGRGEWVKAAADRATLNRNENEISNTRMLSMNESEIKKERK